MLSLKLSHRALALVAAGCIIPLSVSDSFAVLSIKNQLQLTSIESDSSLPKAMCCGVCKAFSPSVHPSVPLPNREKGVFGGKSLDTSTINNFIIAAQRQ